MGVYSVHEQAHLIDAAERLGRKAIALGLIPSFTVQHFADNILFSVVDYPKLLTPTEAYLCFQRLIEEFDAIPMWLSKSPLKLVQWAIADI